MVSASRDTTLRLWDLKGLTAGLLPRCFLDGAMPRGQVGMRVMRLQEHHVCAGSEIVRLHLLHCWTSAVSSVKPQVQFSYYTSDKASCPYCKHNTTRCSLGNEAATAEGLPAAHGSCACRWIST